MMSQVICYKVMSSATEFGKVNASGELGPAHKLQFQMLPHEIVGGISENQRYALAFASRVYKVVSARVQTFQTGSVSHGTVGFAGLGHSFGAHWGAFAGAGSINQSSVNQFRTDIQLKLTDEKTGHSTFISRSLPFAITLALDPGDTVAIYYVVGGLRRHYQFGDFGMAQWTPFVGKSLSTGQIIPLNPLPGLLPPSAGGSVVCGIVLFVFGLLCTMGFVAGSDALGIFGLITMAIGALPVFLYTRKKKRYREDLATSNKYGSAMAI